jgi:hypothetical protein
MESALGWTLLSREALRRAEEHLREGEQGVRDEIGFLALHQAYADRFFPGTSVLQTRLRYILFVPWLYERVARRTDRRPVSRIIQQEEIDLARRLRQTYGMSSGVIGARSYPRPTSQPPSMVYWTALVNWGILRPMIDGSFPPRATVHRILSRSRSISRLRDDDKQPLEEGYSFFITLPEPPPEWENRQADLKLELSADEAQFIRRQLVGTSRPGRLSGSCLLARIAEQRISIADVDDPWLRDIREIADQDDCEALLRAQQVAALVAVGRAVYAALVEQICETDDKRPMPERHRSFLEQVVEKHGREALKLDITAVNQDAPNPLPGRVLDVLSETQSWLRHGDNYIDLRALYERAEIRRKGRRARLAQTLAGRDRRAEWNSEEYPLAGPLHYRWRNVKRLLGDL